MPRKKPPKADRNLNGARGLTKKKQAAQEAFASLFDGSEEKPTPEQVVVDVMHGKGDNKITERQLEAAKVLLPYRLPKLSSVEAHVAREGMSHEEWIASLEDGGDE